MDLDRYHPELRLLAIFPGTPVLAETVLDFELESMDQACRSHMTSWIALVDRKPASIANGDDFEGFRRRRVMENRSVVLRPTTEDSRVGPSDLDIVELCGSSGFRVGE